MKTPPPLKGAKHFGVFDKTPEIRVPNPPAKKTASILYLTKLRFKSLPFFINLVAHFSCCGKDSTNSNNLLLIFNQRLTIPSKNYCVL